MATTPDKPVNRLLDIFGRLRSSHLLLIVGGLFLADLVIPDPLPFLDEILLGAATLLLARWQLRKTEPAEAREKPPPKNVTPKAH